LDIGFRGSVALESFGGRFFLNEGSFGLGGVGSIGVESAIFLVGLIWMEEPGAGRFETGDVGSDEEVPGRSGEANGIVALMRFVVDTGFCEWGIWGELVGLEALGMVGDKAEGPDDVCGVELEFRREYSAREIGRLTTGSADVCVWLWGDDLGFPERAANKGFENGVNDSRVRGEVRLSEIGIGGGSIWPLLLDKSGERGARDFWAKNSVQQVLYAVSVRYERGFEGATVVDTNFAGASTDTEGIAWDRAEIGFAACSCCGELGDGSWRFWSGQMD
jgi:hypothetical protein